ncbi:uncharacterized protein [Dendropsophus ebraccatus]|uniref:uncharacterized protein isoform X1 n=1 Tax=Dendropsophus ebraccatus TaxID=150705 RepID=UPI0038315C9C
MAESSVIGNLGLEIPIKDDGGHISGGLIGGIVGLIAAVVVIIFCAIYWCRRRRRRQRPEMTDLEEVVVLIPDVPDMINISKDKPHEEEETMGKEEVPQHHNIITVLKRTTEHLTKKSKIVDAHGRIRDPVPITLKEKKQEILRKKPFLRFHYWLKRRREKSRTRSQIKREREEKTKNVNLWLNRRRERIRKTQDKSLKMRKRRSLLCCG